MTDVSIVCPYCKRNDFASRRGLSQHILKTKACSKQDRAAVFSKDEGYMTADEFLEMAEIFRRNKRLDVTQAHKDFVYFHKKTANGRQEYVLKFDENAFGMEHEYDDNLDDDSHVDYDDGEEYEENSLGDYIPVANHQPDESIRDDFDEYMKFAENHLIQFSRAEQVAVELMSLLRRTKASLDTYESIMEWHFLATGKIRRHEKVGRHPDFISRTKLFARLKQRYNLSYKVGKKWVDRHNTTKVITLPGSRSKATIILNDVKACIQSLLTDPRIVDEDYLFFDDDPFCPPPEHIQQIGDVNTGRAYTETYKVRIQGRPGKKVLMPFIWYIDGATTGQFADLPITQLKFTLGIFTNEARKKPHMWRIVGYLPKISKHKSRGRRKLLESGHVDSMLAHQDMGFGEGNRAGAKVSPAQDLHTMMDEILAPFVKMQEKGSFLWDLAYKDKVYEDIEFVPFTQFFKVDSDEAEKLTGKYTARSGNVKCLCRYCCCPTSESDRPRANYPRKTVEMLANLVENNDKEGLKNLSQQHIKNSLHRLTFGDHNGEGIHGACPMEMLHALLLGIFKYIRDCFFEQIGESSLLAQEINALAVEYGCLFCRQSDRDMPKTKFANGIQKGKLMAKEYPGVLLIIAAILRSTEGRRLLEAKTGSSFAEDGGVDDWIMLVETLLMWEMWLKSDVMERFHVERSRQKHLYIMYLIRKVGRRVKGMGLKIVKYHSIMHMTEDILNFGVPMNYDTGSDESGHKPTKTAAKLTQKRAENHEHQVGVRLQELHCLDLAMEEIVNHRPLWCYFDEILHQTAGNLAVKAHESRLGGSRFETFFDENSGRDCLQLKGKKKAAVPMKVERCFVKFVAGLTKIVANHLPNLEVRTNHYRQGGMIFRGNPMHSGSVWRDWVMVDWDDWGVLPNKIWGFVDLRGLAQNNDIRWGGLHGIPPGLYAIVENARYVEDHDERHMSELLTPIMKEVGRMQRRRVKRLNFYLADVEAFVEPVTVIPDVGGAANGYFVMRQRVKWREDFTKWLESEHEQFPDFPEDFEEPFDPAAQYDEEEESEDSGDESDQDDPSSSDDDVPGQNPATDPEIEESSGEESASSGDESETFDKASAQQPLILGRRMPR